MHSNKPCLDDSISEYEPDILSHMLHMEKQTLCDADMIDLQPELEWQMRPFLLDFLVESHSDLHLSPETLFLTMNIIDRYSSKRVVYRRHYQLVGCTALWIAAKYSEKKDKIPNLKTLSHLCCSAYETHMFIQMESHILTTLGWSVGHPTCDLYIDYHLKQWPFLDNNKKLIAKHMALYMCELSMFHKALLAYQASTIAACAVNLTLLVLQEPVADYSDSNSDSFKCLELLAAAICIPSSCLERKYSKPQYSSVYQMVEKFLNYRRSLSFAAANAASSDVKNSSIIGAGTESIYPFINATIPTPGTPAGHYTAGYSSDSPASFNDNDSTLTLDFEAVQTPTYGTTVQNSPELALSTTSSSSVVHPHHHHDPVNHYSKHSVPMYPYPTQNPILNGGSNTNDGNSFMFP